MIVKFLCNCNSQGLVICTKTAQSFLYNDLSILAITLTLCWPRITSAYLEDGWRHGTALVINAAALDPLQHREQLLICLQDIKYTNYCNC